MFTRYTWDKILKQRLNFYFHDILIVDVSNNVYHAMYDKMKLSLIIRARYRWHEIRKNYVSVLSLGIHLLMISREHKS